jgi:colicin import membrane protein
METMETNQLAEAISSGSLTPTSAAELLAAFQPHFNAAMVLRAESAAIIVTDATQVTEIKQARAKRLALAKIRVDAEKTRKAMKEESLKTGRAIDKVASVIESITEPEEARLLEMEKIAERAEAARKAAVKASRETLLAPFQIETGYYQLADMPEEAFQSLLNSTRIAHEAKIEAARKVEADRLAAEAARVERERVMAAENERLRLEAIEREKAAQAERAKADAERKAAEEKARKEREAIEAKARAEREKLEAQASAEREARQKIEEKAAEAKRIEDARIAAEAKARKAAEAAPDKAKLSALAVAVRALPIPTMATPSGKAALARIETLVASLAKAIDNEAEYLG